MEFEWDENKNAANLAKHGIAFEDAIEVFDDPNELTERSEFGEEIRFETTGRVRGTVFFVVHTMRSRGDDELSTRIISARAASEGSVHAMSDNNERIVRYVRKPLTEEQIARIDALKDLPDESIDFSDIPEAGDEFFANAKRGQMYRLMKQQITLRLDADILDWFKRDAAGGKGYQTGINRALREYIATQTKKAG